MQIPSPHLATEPYPAPPVPDHWPLTTDHWPLTTANCPLSTAHCRWTAGPFRPSLVRGDTPCNAPCSYATVRARRPQFESRITNHGRSGPPLCGGTPPATPPCSYATVRARRPQLESRITAVPALPCAGDTPRNAPCSYATVRARRPQFESRITNHGRSGRSGQYESCRLLRPPRQFVSTVLDFASPCASDPRRCPRERSPAGPRRTACRRSSTCCWTRHRGSHN